MPRLKWEEQDDGTWRAHAGESVYSTITRTGIFDNVGGDDIKREGAALSDITVAMEQAEASLTKRALYFFGALVKAIEP